VLTLQFERTSNPPTIVKGYTNHLPTSRTWMKIKYTLTNLTALFLYDKIYKLVESSHSKN